MCAIKMWPQSRSFAGEPELRTLLFNAVLVLVYRPRRCRRPRGLGGQRIEEASLRPQLTQGTTTSQRKPISDSHITAHLKTKMRFVVCLGLLASILLVLEAEVGEAAALDDYNDEGKELRPLKIKDT